MTNTRVGSIPGYNNALGGNRFAYPYYFVGQTSGAVMGTTGFIPHIVSDIRFKVTTGGAETIKISASKDNANFTDLIPIDESTGLAFASANLTTGAFVLKVKNNAQWKFFKFTKSATASAGTVVLACALTRPVSGSYF